MRATVLLAAGVGLLSCKGASKSDMAVSSTADPNSAQAMDQAVVAGAAGSAAMAMDEGKADSANEKAKGKEEATTWKRSQIVPNSSRVMVGDHDELSLRAMQTRVMVDGFRA